MILGIVIVRAIIIIHTSGKISKFISSITCMMMLGISYSTLTQTVSPLPNPQI
ncbi:MAG: hypothetical protein CSYNP_03991 [Syntrophus sp. SKADARSKE-3]|nr:hypothetical protein [Syntrophus sp. SKADARSKE-3]